MTMREILFRGKCTWEDKWVYGVTVPGYNDELITKAEWFDTDDDYGLEVDRCSVWHNTVGQFTGLTDKNGKKIFEGDILAGDEYPYTYETAWNYFAEVVWLDDSKAFGLYTFKNPQSNVRGISHGLTDYIEDFESSEWEVIGNIHDNPDMMEDK